MGKLAVTALATVLAAPAFAQQQPSTVTSMPFASTPLDGSELLYLVQKGNPRKTTVGSLLYPSVGGTPYLTVSNLAALRALPAGLVGNLVRSYYANSGDAPPLAYAWFASCPGSPDNVALYIAPNAGGGGCWSAAADPNIDDLREWGEVNDATATTCGAGNVDNGPIIQVAVNALGAGHTLRQRGGVACIKTGGNGLNGVLISQPAEGIHCDGMTLFSGGHHDVGTEFTAPNGFIGYTYGATLFTFKSATTQSLYGNSFWCPVNGNVIGGNNFAQAAIGVDHFSVRNGSWKIVGAHFQTYIEQVDIDTSIGEAPGSNGNEYWLNFDQSIRFDGGGIGGVGTAAWDLSQDIFYIVFGVWSGGGSVLDFGGADSELILNATGYNNNTSTGNPFVLIGNTYALNTIAISGAYTYKLTTRTNGVAASLPTGLTTYTDANGNVWTYQNPASPGCGIALRAANNIDTARNNTIIDTGWANSACSVYAEGTENGKSTPSTENNIYAFDDLDTQAAPVIGIGAALNWGTYSTPIGLNYFTQSGATVSQRTSNGVVTNTGATTSVAPGATYTIHFTAAWSALPTAGTQLYFPTACLSVTIQSNTATTRPPHYSCTPGTTTTFTITNDDPSITVAGYNYSVTGN